MSAAPETNAIAAAEQQPVAAEVVAVVDAVPAAEVSAAGAPVAEVPATVGTTADATAEEKPAEEATKYETPKEEPVKAKLNENAQPAEDKAAEEPAKAEGTTDAKGKRSSIFQRLLIPLAHKKKAETPISSDDKTESPKNETTTEGVKEDAKPAESPKAEESSKVQSPRKLSRKSSDKGAKIDDDKEDGAAPDGQKIGRRLSVKANKVRLSFFERTKKALEEAAGKIEHHQKKTSAEVSEEKPAEAAVAPVEAEQPTVAAKPAEAPVVTA